MEWLIVVIPAVAVVYYCWQVRNYRYWQQAVTASGPRRSKVGLPPITIVVPFRNEAEHLPALLGDLLAQDYPAHYEVIFVDDHSTDGGKALLEGSSGPPVRILSLADFPEYDNTLAHKKAAISLAVSLAHTEMIVTTDADCRWPPETLRRMGEAFRDGADVVLGPVFVEPVNDLCDAFQALDLAGYQLFSAAAVWAHDPALANGAHFGFRRSAFEGVGGYRGVDHLPSGDDVLLLHKFTAAGRYSIVYIAAADGGVLTKPVAGWAELWKQRLRWAGKAGTYASDSLSIAQGLSFATSLAILTGFVLALVDARFVLATLVAWGFKAVIDYRLLLAVLSHYGRASVMRYYLPVQFIYPAYLVSVGVAALLGFRPRWKGRRT